MPTPSKGPRMGGSPAHERLMLANLATALFEHGRITTTEAKAKRLRPYAEHLITFGKRGDLHARRQVLKRLTDKSVVHTLFAEIGPRYENRPGGYTRILKLGNRKGDNAPMALIELVEPLTVAQTAVGEAERARGTRVAARKAPTGATRESAAALASQSPTAAAVAAEPDGVDVPAGTPVEPADDLATSPTATAVVAEPDAVDVPAGTPVEPAALDADAATGETAAFDDVPAAPAVLASEDGAVVAGDTGATSVAVGEDTVDAEIETADPGADVELMAADIEADADAGAASGDARGADDSADPDRT